MFTDHGFYDRAALAGGTPAPRHLVVSQVLIDLIEAQFPGTLRDCDDGYDWLTADGTVVRLTARSELCD